MSADSRLCGITKRTSERKSAQSSPTEMTGQEEIGNTLFDLVLMPTVPTDHLTFPDFSL